MSEKSEAKTEEKIRIGSIGIGEIVKPGIKLNGRYDLFVVEEYDTDGILLRSVGSTEGGGLRERADTIMIDGETLVSRAKRAEIFSAIKFNNVKDLSGTFGFVNMGNKK